MCFPGIEKPAANDEPGELTEMPYTLHLTDVSGYYDNCYFCNERKCGGCLLKYNDDIKVKDLLKAVKIEHNDTLFSHDK